MTIDRVEPQEIAPNVTKSVVFFKGEKKGLVLNEVNLRTIEHNTIIPVDEWEKWTGYQVTLYASSIKVKEEQTPCIRVKILVNSVAFKEREEQQATA